MEGIPGIGPWLALLKDGGLVFSTLFVTYLYLIERKRNDAREEADRKSREDFHEKIIDVLTEVKVVVSNGNTLLNLLVSERK